MHTGIKASSPECVSHVSQRSFPSSPITYTMLQSNGKFSQGRWEPGSRSSLYLPPTLLLASWVVWLGDVRAGTNVTATQGIYTGISHGLGTLSHLCSKTGSAICKIKPISVSKWLQFLAITLAVSKPWSFLLLLSVLSLVVLAQHMWVVICDRGVSICPTPCSTSQGPEPRFLHSLCKDAAEFH